jgi:hypothetical protein
MILVNRQEVPLLGLNLWVHRNKPGTTTMLSKPVKLELPEGISVYPTGTATPPRLPLLGLRGLVRNHIRVTIDGMSVSMRQVK